ncbi:uncharacterized protein LOC131304547 [Rhododendron vialii]|uniref:uncharacterized protein LOC131304547 n=1 Tax=Rhododendron vialii TaxID=182163 RepID=UPI00265FB4E4|nr:uncharacterized protein LOC131304547 [Rhododendron vialii]
MVLMRFASLVLGLIYLLHVLRGSSACGHEGSGMQGNRLMVVDDVPATPARKMKLEGRKMLAEEVPRREIEKEEETNGGTSKISGKDPNASKRAARSQDHFNNKVNNSPTLKANTMREPVHFPSIKPHYYHFQDSKAISTESARARQDESRTLFDDRAIAEIANLMRKDYGNIHGSPPSNNREPND